MIFAKKQIEINGCPKCNKQPILKTTKYRNKLQYIYVCEDCNMYKITYEKSHKKAIKAWNEFSLYTRELIRRVEAQRRLRKILLEKECDFSGC